MLNRSRRLAWVAVLTVVGSVAVAADEKRVPLQIELPKPSSVIFHPWQHLKDKDVEWPPDPNRTPLLVPEGTENVALRMPVTVDHDLKPVSGSLDQVTDGEKEFLEEDVVELPAAARWVQIDLRQSTRIFAVMMWHDEYYDRACRDVIVQVSDDPTFAKGVTTIFNNDADGSTGLGKGRDRLYVETEKGRLVDAKGVRARYVRLYTRGARLRGRDTEDATHWTEVEVYGTPTAAGRALQKGY
jgi:hypothetical protein